MVDARREALRAALVLGAVALLTRAAVFGDIAYFNDEYFYWDAGLRLHDGLLPYVGVWDRKGPGLFLLYWAITGVWRGVLGFQIAACLSAWATACVLRATARQMMGPTGALMAGVLYLAALPMFGGQGGQTPVFYNLFMALAAWLVVRGQGTVRESWALPAAMALAGLTLTFKPSALPEAAFLGLYALARMRADGAGWPALTRRTLAMKAAGIAPYALFALAFAAVGHLGDMIAGAFGSNLARGYVIAGTAGRVLSLVELAAPVLVLAAVGLALAGRAERRFAGLWLGASAIGVCLPPSFYLHYMLPLMLPASLCAGFAMDRRPWGLIAGVAATAALVVGSSALDFNRPAQARAVIGGVIARIRARDPAPRVLVYEGPMALYGLMGVWPPSPLLDNFHLYFPAEDNASGHDTAAETARDLAWRPSVVITYHDWPALQENARSAALVHAYTRRCRLWETVRYPEALFDAHTIDVWGDCLKR